MQREDIHIVSRHSNLAQRTIAEILKKHVYNDRRAWQKFLRLLFVSLGVGFTASGIIFFFAYNWANLHKFVRIGLIEGVLIATTILVLFPKIKHPIKNVILTGASVLVGVLFAVFGQIYQTGANAYDLFVAWTVFISLWVWVLNFPPLWLLYLILINTTFVLYSQQMAKDWSVVLVCTLLFLINVVVVVAGISLGRKKIPDWFLNIVALGAIGYATIGVVIGIFESYPVVFSVLLLMTAIAFALGIRYGLKTKSSFYLSAIPLSVIIMVSALFVRISEGEMMLLFVGLFIVASITLTVKNLLNLQKKWSNEK